MFYGDMADKSKVIRIPDVAPIGFENLLRYAYTGKVLVQVFRTTSLIRSYLCFRLAEPQLSRGRHADGVRGQEVSPSPPSQVSHLILCSVSGLDLTS